MTSTRTSIEVEVRICIDGEPFERRQFGIDMTLLQAICQVTGLISRHIISDVDVHTAETLNTMIGQSFGENIEFELSSGERIGISVAQPPSIERERPTPPPSKPYDWNLFRKRLAKGVGIALAVTAAFLYVDMKRSVRHWAGTRRTELKRTPHPSLGTYPHV